MSSTERPLACSILTSVGALGLSQDACDLPRAAQQRLELVVEHFDRQIAAHARRRSAGTPH
jgi:hypothetical protein